MNPDTNELVRIDGIDELMKRKKEGFIPIPQTLERAASLMLGKKKKVIVSKSSGGKLSKWAAKKRSRKAELKKMVENCNAYYQAIEVEQGV